LDIGHIPSQEPFVGCVRLTIGSPVYWHGAMAYIGRCVRSRVYTQLPLPFSADWHMHPPAEPAQMAPGTRGAQCIVLAGPYIIVAAGASVYLRLSESPRHANNLTPKHRDMDGNYGVASATILGESSSNNTIVELHSSDASDITALAIDQSRPSSSPSGERDQEWNMRTCSSRLGVRHEGEIHVAAFHRSGHFDIFSVVSSHPRVDDRLGPSGSPLPGASDPGSSLSLEHDTSPDPRIGVTFGASSLISGSFQEAGAIRESANAKLIYSHPAPPSTRAPGVELPPETDFTRSRMSNIMCAAYHHPLLIALSKKFHLLVYYLPDLHVPPPQGCGVTMGTSLPVRPVLVRSVHSYTSYMPSSMSLARVPVSGVRGTLASAANGQSNGIAVGGNALFKLVLAYTVPVYPAHWTAGAAELTITVGHFTGAGNQATANPAETTRMTAWQPDVRIVSSRTASAMPNGWHELPTPATPTLSHLEDKEDLSEGEGEGAGDNEGEECGFGADFECVHAQCSNSTSTSAASTSSAFGPDVSQSPNGIGNSTQRAASSLSKPFAQHVGDRKDSKYTSIAQVPASVTSGGLTMRLKAMEQWTRKLGNVISTQTDGKWIVIAGNDNVLQVSSGFSHIPVPLFIGLCNHFACKKKIRFTACIAVQPHPFQYTILTRYMDTRLALLRCALQMVDA
jgi:hypothetical protein